jgi:N-acetylmuramoyl-L-alanine amidase
VYEKRVTLAIARQVAALLRTDPGVEVKLTRERDQYLTLRERVRLANREGADVFVSIHCNASPSRAQKGFETWILTPEAQDVDARALREGDGPPRGDLTPGVASILDELERDASAPWSGELAARLQARLAEARGAEGSRGVRQGTQDVLMGPTMPAALVEVGFLDHPTEGAELLTHEVRTKLAGAIAQGILDFRDLRAADPR